ncbi:signaling recognition particle receptor family protein, partial [Neisseria sp.]|uniref:signal recognition particle-docking protein FtsY n=1 Tax=Neisseria sp. TaxID=192066 RepID=UPI0026DCE418
MFSFFKRKKKQDNAEPAAEPVQTPAAPEEEEAAPEAESGSPLAVPPPAEAQPDAVETHLQNNPVGRPAANTVNPEAGLPDQYNPDAPADKIHIRPSENEAAPAEAAEILKQPDNTDTVTAPVPAAAAAAATAEEGEPAKPGWAARLKKGLTKSRDQMAKSLAGVFGGGKIDEDLYEELETVLITGDMGMEATEALMKDVRNRVSLKGLKDGNELRGALKDALYDLIKPLEQPLILPENRGEPFVIMLAGINGAGKTTSIGKLAKYFQSQGKSVLLAAGDTFRAAAREQLQEWGARNGVTVISQTTGDSAAVCFDAVEAAKARGIDIVLADTAGRLPTQLHLMEE